MRCEAEMAYYREHHDEAVDGPSLEAAARPLHARAARHAAARRRATCPRPSCATALLGGLRFRAFADAAPR